MLPFLMNEKEAMDNIIESMKNMRRNNRQMANEISVMLKKLEEPARSFDKKEKKL